MLCDEFLKENRKNKDVYIPHTLYNIPNNNPLTDRQYSILASFMECFDFRTEETIDINLLTGDSVIIHLFGTNIELPQLTENCKIINVHDITPSTVYDKIVVLDVNSKKDCGKLFSILRNRIDNTSLIIIRSKQSPDKYVDDKHSLFEMYSLVNLYVKSMKNEIDYVRFQSLEQFNEEVKTFITDNTERVEEIYHQDWVLDFELRSAIVHNYNSILLQADYLFSEEKNGDTYVRRKIQNPTKNKNVFTDGIVNYEYRQYVALIRETHVSLEDLYYSVKSSIDFKILTVDVREND